MLQTKTLILTTVDDRTGEVTCERLSADVCSRIRIACTLRSAALQEVQRDCNLLGFRGLPVGVTIAEEYSAIADRFNDGDK